jgi:putative DNA primase/helicase
MLGFSNSTASLPTSTESQLREKLRKIEARFAGAGTSGMRKPRAPFRQVVFAAGDAALPLMIPVILLGGGGTHYIFKIPKFRIRKDSGAKVFGPGVDVMSDGAIIIVPPSFHASGKRYRWQKGASLLAKSPGSLPKKWRNHIKAQQNLDKPKLADSETIVTGARNDTLTSLAGKLHNTGIGREALLAALLAVNQRCEPPLDKNEVERIVRSIGTKPSKPGAVQGDLAERVMKLVLEGDFGGGDHLILQF